MSTAIVIFAPGLDARLLDSGLLPGLRESARRARCAELVVSGLGFPECLRANVLWGAPPSVHGLSLGRQHPRSPLEEALGNACAWTDAAHAVRLRLLERPILYEAALRDGVRSPAHLSAAGELDAELVSIVDRYSASTDVWIVGAPAPVVCQRHVAAPRGASVRGAVAEWPSTLAAPQRDALLRELGIERILDGESLSVLGLRRPLALAEPQVSFESGPAVSGHPLAAERAAPQLLAWLVGESGPWPASVHDLRVAPTLAARLGVTGLNWAERALA